MNIVENGHRKAKTPEDGSGQRADSETKASIKIEIERCDGNRLAGQMHMAGANLSEEGATLLMMKADF